MCGRYTLRTPQRDVVELFDLALEHVDESVLGRARFNIAPTQQVAAVRFDRDRRARSLVRLQWGLIPSWADDPAIGSRMINARGESVATKPAFRDAFRRRRCLLPADGFFEWKPEAGGKQPYYVRRRDERPFAFAGLWDRWQRGELTIESCTIVTTEANEALSPLHDRMPAIIPTESFTAWLDPDLDDRRRLEALLAGRKSPELTYYAVSRAVNTPRNDGPECTAPAPAGKSQGSLFD